MRRLIMLLALGYGLTLAAPAIAQDSTPVADLGPAIVPPGAPAFGWEQGQWAAAWFRWYFDHPSVTEECAVGQGGPVWFLPAIPITGGTARFDCVIPADRTILVPLPIAANASAEACEATVDEPFAMPGGLEARGGVEAITVTVDGQIVPGLERFRIRPTRVPPSGSVEEGEGATPVANAYGAGWFACGYIVLLQPLAPGEHTVRLMMEAEGRLVNDLIYALSVVPPGHS